MGVRHVSIDIETMASNHNAAVVAIGIAEFFPETGEIGRTLEVRCTLESMYKLGRSFDPETIEWWMTQSDEARKSLLKEPRATDAVAMMTAAHEFLKELAPSAWDLCIWAKSPTFDLAILRHLAEQLKVKWHGHYGREYCVRTMLLIAHQNDWQEVFKIKADVKHGALSDAVCQAKQVMSVLKKIKS